MLVAWAGDAEKGAFATLHQSVADGGFGVWDIKLICRDKPSNQGVRIGD